MSHSVHANPRHTQVRHHGRSHYIGLVSQLRIDWFTGIFRTGAHLPGGGERVSLEHLCSQRVTPGESSPNPAYSFFYMVILVRWGLLNACLFSPSKQHSCKETWWVNVLVLQKSLSRTSEEKPDYSSAAVDAAQGGAFKGTLNPFAALHF